MGYTLLNPLILLEIFILSDLGLHMLSIQQIIDRLSGLQGTKDVSPWEEGFITTLVKYRNEGRVDLLSEKQLEIMQSIFNKHFSA